jgi:hypothetical protein
MIFLLFFGSLVILVLTLLFIGLVVAFFVAVIYYTVRGINDKFQRKTGRRGSETIDFPNYPGPVRHQ